MPMRFSAYPRRASRNVVKILPRNGTVTYFRACPCGLWRDILRGAEPWAEPWGPPWAGPTWVASTRVSDGTFSAASRDRPCSKSDCRPLPATTGIVAPRLDARRGGLAKTRRSSGSGLGSFAFRAAKHCWPVGDAVGADVSLSVAGWHVGATSFSQYSV